ncbi:alpha/beta hydrolase [Sporomusa acidovorans]|uniref:AB hydrolase-1 domain-containing protein n=1 Tax=Sporomusa acidovorans (strain ATCC 49682 / DSM 3132 / Mol) TaxID=1123286 RepID=A0ABZ3IVJ9_SPOA4|nr:alpha/beta fold hydrolase [Sporomusa acidovorans]OZC15252.1 alpha/beta hydrolase family protein [Sporomusa acidovorans DSM 3132]SDE91236.1 putative redox protein [Sporomusa acidovorans]
MNCISIAAGTARLSAVFHPSTRYLDKTLIISHGFRGSKDGGGRAVRLAETLAASGIHVLRYDFTPLQSLSCQISELTAVVEHTRQTIGGRLFLLGRSLGGTTSLAVAAGDKNISGLILWATPWDLAATFRLALGNHYEQLAAGNTLRLTDEYGDLVLAPDFIRDFSNHPILTYSRRLDHCPLLILHGTADAIVPCGQARTLYELAAGPKKLILYPGGDHHLAAQSSQAGKDIAAWLGQF